jgi:hypothetical protein
MEQLGSDYVDFNMPHIDERDYEIYFRLYDEMRTIRRKFRPQATMPGKIEHNGPPLDFSFLKLEDVHSLRKERPRGGKRKPIEKDEDEEEDQGLDRGAGGEDKNDGDKPRQLKELLTVKNTSVP